MGDLDIEEEMKSDKGEKRGEYIEEENEDKRIKIKTKDELYAIPFPTRKDIENEEIENRNRKYEKIHSDCKKRKIAPNPVSFASTAPQEKKHKCCLCPEGFDELSQLDWHRIHVCHGYGQNLYFTGYETVYSGYACNFCGSEYNTLDDLNMHKNV